MSHASGSFLGSAGTWRRTAIVLALLAAGAVVAAWVPLARPARAAAATPAAPVGSPDTIRAHPRESVSQEEAASAPIRPSGVVTVSVYLPVIGHSALCQPIPGESYGDLSVSGDPTTRPAEEHADLNLALRGYALTDAYKGLVNRESPVDDPLAPQLPGLFADARTPAFAAVYQAHHWYWGSNSRGPLITDPEVTLAGLAVTPGETIHVPASGYDIGDGYEVLVLYASRERITFKYTREDDVVRGYALHVEGICVEPRLLALYESWNEAGRGRLPALRAGQAFGRARGDEIGVAVRDTGAFMDPRSGKDWWQGR